MFFISCLGFGFSLVIDDHQSIVLTYRYYVIIDQIKQSLYTSQCKSCWRFRMRVYAKLKLDQFMITGNQDFWSSTVRNFRGTVPKDPRQQSYKAEKWKIHDLSFSKHKKVFKNSAWVKSYMHLKKHTKLPFFCLPKSYISRLT